MLAKDGKPYDINNLIGEEPFENEIEIIQYLRPAGRRRRMFAFCEPELAKLTKEFNFIISAEELTTGEIAIYGRLQEETDKDEISVVTNDGPEIKTELENIIKNLIFKQGLKDGNDN